MMFRKVQQAPTYVEQTHPTDCLWIYMKAVNTHNTIHIYTHLHTYIHTYIHTYLYTHNINTHTHEVRTAVMLKFRVFRDVTPCRLGRSSEVSKYPETSPSGSSSPEDEANTILRNVGKNSPNDIVTSQKTQIFYTNYLEQSPSWEANRVSASQEIPRILYNTNVHYRIHNSRTPIPQHQSSPCPTYHFLKIHFDIILPSKSWSSKCSPSLRFPYHNLYAPLLSLYVLGAPPISVFYTKII